MNRSRPTGTGRSEGGALHRIARWVALLGLAGCVVGAAGCSGCSERTPSPDVDAAGDLGANSDTSVVADAPADTGEAADSRGLDTADDVSELDTESETDGVDADDSGVTDVDGADGADTVDTAPTCGDGTVEGGEACDDGNTASGDYCAADCSAVTGSCGDGTLQSNESCDDGSITSNCDTYHDGGDGTCQPPGTCSQGYTIVNGKCVAKKMDQHVHIYVSNTCKLKVSPSKVTVPRGQTVSFTYHNHSNWYSVDVWLSYNGGFLDLKKGNKWDDPFTHCNTGSRPYQAYADITINGLSLRDSSCPGHRMKIYCK